MKHPTILGAVAVSDGILGRPGKLLPGDVHKYGWPRSDLHVTVGGTELAPALALGSWAGLFGAGMEGQVMAMGDLVLLAHEVNAVIRELEAHGIEVTALHSHMLRETPRLFFTHFWAVDDPTRVAEGLKASLARMAVK